MDVDWIIDQQGDFLYSPPGGFFTGSFISSEFHVSLIIQLKKMISPPYLKHGDTVGIVASARKVTPAEIEPAGKLYHLLILILVLLSLSGCFSMKARKVFKESIKTCYSDKITTTENEMIDLNGYYLMYVKGDFSSGSPNTPYYETYDSLPKNIFFFKDGIYLENFLVLDDKPATVQNYFNHMYDTNVDTVTSKFHATWWGTYKIKGDTIISQFFFIGSLNAGWFGREEWYKIINNQTIKSIYAHPIGGDVSEEQLQEFWYNRDRYTTGKLVPLEKIPSSDCWLKQEKWFWCEENQWREYMKANGYKIRRKDR